MNRYLCVPLFGALIFSMSISAANIVYLGSTVTGISYLQLASGSFYDVSFADGLAGTVYSGITFDAVYKVRAEAVSAAMAAFIGANPISSSTVRGCSSTSCILFLPDVGGNSPFGLAYGDNDSVTLSRSGTVSSSVYPVVLAIMDTTNITDFTLATFTPSLPDIDEDAVANTVDNCPYISNANQLNTDGANDGGDACDTDDDNDTWEDYYDNCPLVVNRDQADSNNDGIGNAWDNDSDGVPNHIDNCPLIPNSDQIDSDRDGRGDLCTGLPPGC